MRILLLSHFFPPLNAIASHRAYGWARAWTEMGHEVHVVTPVKYPIDGPFGLDLLMDGLTVHAVPYFWDQLDKEAPSAPSPPSAQQNARWSDVKRRTRVLRNRLGLLGDVRMLLVPSLVRAGAALAARLPFDLLVSNFGPASTLIAGSILARKTRLPWVVDYQDLWSGNYAARRGGRAGKIGTTFERFVTRHAAMVVTLSQGLRKRLEETLGREAVVIYFGYLDDGDPPAPRRRAEQSAQLVYAGRVYERLQTAARFFRCAGRALARRPDLAERLRVDFFGPEQAVLRQMADQHGAAAIVHLNGAVAWQEAVAIGREAEALLFFDWLDPDAEGVLPGKLFEYLRSGRPIVFIGSGAETEAARLARRSGAAIVLQSEAAIEQLLLEWPAGIPSLARDESFVAELSCGHQARLLLAEIERRVFRRDLGSPSAAAPAQSSSSRSSSTSR